MAGIHLSFLLFSENQARFIRLCRWNRARSRFCACRVSPFSSRAGPRYLRGVELTGFVMEHLTDGGGHGQTGVGVDVDFANGALGGLAELLFGDTDGIGEFAAELVDGLHIFLGN